MPALALFTLVRVLYCLNKLELNKPEYNLSNADIPNSKPQSHRFKTNRPPSNPLNPEYKLSQVEYRPPTPPKFIRDHITNDDIEGAKPAVKKYFQTRDVLGVDDISGAKSKGVYLRTNSEYDSLNY